MHTKWLESLSFRLKPLLWVTWNESNRVKLQQREFEKWLLSAWVEEEHDTPVKQKLFHLGRNLILSVWHITHVWRKQCPWFSYDFKLMLADLELKKKADCPQSELPLKRPETMCCTEMFLQCKFNERFLEERSFFPEFDESSGLLWSEFQCSLICFFCNTDQDKSGYLITCSKVAARMPLISEYNP